MSPFTRKLVWTLNILLIVGLIGAITLLVRDDDPSEASTPPTTTTTTTEPDREWVPDGPHAAEIRRAARGLDLSGYEDWVEGDPDDWELGIVKSPTAVSVAINTSTGTRLLGEAKSCDRDELPDGYFDSLFSRGDIVLFSNFSGNDDRDDQLCGGEIILVEEAEAEDAK